MELEKDLDKEFMENYRKVFTDIYGLDESEDDVKYAIYNRQRAERRSKRITSEIRERALKKALAITIAFGIGALGVAHVDNVMSQKGIYDPNEPTKTEQEFEGSKLDYNDYLTYSKIVHEPVNEENYKEFKQMSEEDYQALLNDYESYEGQGRGGR